MYAEVAWILVSSGTQVQPELILDPDYLSDYLFVSYDYGKRKYVRSNHSPFMNKNLSKAIMLKVKLRNIFSRIGLRKIKVDTLNKEICV